MGDTVSSLLFQPPPPSKLKEHKIVWMRTSKGNTIPGFYISYKHERGVDSCKSLTADEIPFSNPHEGISILYSHANAEDLGSIYPWCKFLSKSLKVNLFAYDYSGYGMAMDTGKLHRSHTNRLLLESFSDRDSLPRLVSPLPCADSPSEDNCYADIDAAYNYLNKTLQVPARNIVLYGRSLGSGPSCYLAVKSAYKPKEDAEYATGEGPVGGLILHAPFLSVYRVVIDTGCTLPGDKFPNVDIINMVKSPTLLIHGTADQIVPFHHSETLHQALPEEFRAKPLYIEGMSHNNVHAQVRPLFVDALDKYLATHIERRVIQQNRGSSRSPIVVEQHLAMTAEELEIY